jgi:hypothetical protein
MPVLFDFLRALRALRASDLKIVADQPQADTRCNLQAPLHSKA